MKDILAAIAAIDPVTVKLEGLRSVTSNDKILGVLNDDLKRLYGLQQKMMEDAKPGRDSMVAQHREQLAAILAMHFGSSLTEHDHSGCEAKVAELNNLQKKIEDAYAPAEAVISVFWKLVRLEFDALRVRFVGLRKKEGEIVVIEDKDPNETNLSSSLEGMLSGICGHGVSFEVLRARPGLSRKLSSIFAGMFGQR